MGDARISISIGADGCVEWPEGSLIVPEGFTGKLDGYPEGTVVDVYGRYERIDARTQTFHVKRLRVTQTALDGAFDHWRYLRAADEPMKHAGWPRFVAALDTMRGDSSPTAMGLRAVRALLEGRLDEAMVMMGELLTLDTSEATGLLRRLWDAAPHDVVAAWSPRQRSELARAALRDPSAWKWVHPFVASAGLYTYPVHFGGPRPEADSRALFQLIRRLVRDVATREELAEIDQIDQLTLPKKRVLLARLRIEDEVREEEARSDQIDAWYDDPDRDPQASPPDDLGVPLSAEADKLPVRWCGFTVGEHWEDRWTRAPQWLARFYADRGHDATALKCLLDAACVASALDPALVERLERVVFAHATLLDGYALVQLSDGTGCTLRAPRGAFGGWELRYGELDALIEELPEVDVPFARVASRGSGLHWSRRSYRLDAEEEDFADEDATRSRAKRKVESEKPRWVVHARHGRGLVVGSIPGPKGAKLVIEFETAGRKTLLHTFVEDE